MGFFSSKKNKPPKSDIPDDILADVSVNGEKKVNTPPQGIPLTSAEGVIASSTSPFLKSKAANVSGLPGEPNRGAIPPMSTSSLKNAPSEPTPKPFHFADKNPITAEVRFSDPASVKKEASIQDFSRPDFSQITQDKALANKQIEQHAPLKMPAEPPLPQKKSFFSSANLVSLVVFILILGFISGGSWYYLNTRTAEEESPEASIDELEGVEGEQIPQPEGSILIDQPNYLVLDIETITAEQIKALLEDEKEKLIAEGITTPVEYLVVDTNTNPVAFSRFAFLIGADTPNDLVNASLEPFSLYLFLDQGALRMALAVALRAESAESFPANKSVMPQALRKFFYPEEYAVQDFSTLTFAESSYKGTPIFFANIDVASNYAFDMIRQEGILTFANSKSTLRAVIDKRGGASGE